MIISILHVTEIAGNILFLIFLFLNIKNHGLKVTKKIVKVT
uniref:Uncharacterized protein n=1 Tax=Anguilla anguilla TaxID=7936 RepID=A0A0E9S4V5_ANGAN